MENIKKLQPRAFTRFCMSIGAVPSSYLAGLTIEEQLLWFCSYLQNEVIPAVNNNAGAVEELQALYIELKDYVDHYFDNLDVQEEINNKLDAMVESGELQDILAQLIYTLKVYDNINDMKDDTTLADGQKIYCYGYSTKGDKGAGYYYVTDDSLTADNLTIIKLDNGLFAKLVYDDHINVVDTSVLTTSLITTMLNNNVMLYSDEPIPITESILITNDNVKIHDMKFRGNKLTSASVHIILANQVDNLTIENCYFDGNSSNYIRLQYVTNSKVLNNTINGKDNATVSPVVLLYCNNVNITDNTFIDNTGFNVETLFSTVINISNNTFHNPFIEGNYTAIGGEQSVQFISDIEPQRYLLKVNNNAISSDNFTMSYNSTTKQITLSLNSALQANDVVYFRGYRSLECVNINSQSYDINVINNTINGTGDSGVVLCADYHNQQPDHAHATEEDFPRRVNVSNNIITNCACSGVAVINACDDTTISNNVISNCGWLLSDGFSSGIFTLTCKITACNNTISNITVNEFNKEQGIMKYGIYVSPLDQIPGGDTEKYLYLENKLILKNNKISNVIEDNIKFNPFSNYGSQLGVDFDSSASIEFPELNGITSSTGIFNLEGNASISLDTRDTVDGNNSMKVTFGTTGQYYSFNNLANYHVTKKKICIDFFAKASDNKKIANIVYGASGVGNKRNHVEQPLSTEWKLYHLEILVDMQPTILQFRITSNEGAGYALISHIKYSMQNLE